MKRFLSLALALLLASALLPISAMAATSINVELVREFTFKNPGAQATAFTIENTTKRDQEITVTVYDQNEQQNIQTMNFKLLAGDAPFPVQAYVYNTLERDGDLNTYRYTVKVKGGITKTYHYIQRLKITKDTRGGLVYTYKQVYNPHLPNNTASSFGPHFRDVTPKLTDKWYMFTPIDLGIQGRQTFPLVASNMYEIGEVHVDVYQDQVVVSYEMFHEGKHSYTTEKLSEFLTFYNSYADVGIVEPEDMPGPSAFAFNQPFSIQNSLGGDTNVLMFVRNRVSYYPYPAPNSEYVRFWENKDEYKSRREFMLQMMDPIEGQVVNK